MLFLYTEGEDSGHCLTQGLRLYRETEILLCKYFFNLIANCRDGFHLTNTRLQMNPCEAYSTTVKRGENTRQDDDYLTMNSRDFYSDSAAGEEEPVYDVVH